MRAQLSTLTSSCEVDVLPSGGAAPPAGCGVAIVDEATVAHLLLKGILDPALEVAKLQKKVRVTGCKASALRTSSAEAGNAWCT